MNGQEVWMKLVIIPCGKMKIWDKNHDAGPQKARNAYAGSPFKVNREYAESRRCDWMILSPKYGFMRPDFVIPGNYDITFKSPDAISGLELIRQVERQGLANYANVTVLGSVAYVEIVRDAFSNTKGEVDAPFVGRPIGVQMGLIKKFLREESGHGGKA
jgi:hypothetical protein